MHWILLSLVSAFLLGIYDTAKKVSVHQNAVPIVLLCSVSIGAALYLPLILLSSVAPSWIPIESFQVDSMTWENHVLIVAKAILVGASWTLAFTALKELPLSIAAPIRATSPLWTILIAVLFFGERPSAFQWCGVVIVLIGFWRFTLVGRSEGIRFVGNRSVTMMIVATLLGAASSLYDKWLLQYAGFRPVTMQAWFTIYLVPVMVPLAVRWVSGNRSIFAADPTNRAVEGENEIRRFHWRNSILLISPLLISADWFYFVALSDPNALVSIVSVIRRCSVVVALVFAAHRLSEQNFRAKLVCAGIILLGVALLTWRD